MKKPLRARTNKNTTRHGGDPAGAGAVPSRYGSTAGDSAGFPYFIASPPPGWQTGSYISGWATKWANEVLPIATEAHAKLTFHANPKSWGAKSSDLPGYDQWARKQVSLKLAHADYRLAAILKKVWP